MATKTKGLFDNFVSGVSNTISSAANSFGNTIKNTFDSFAQPAAKNVASFSNNFGKTLSNISNDYSNWNKQNQLKIQQQSQQQNLRIKQAFDSFKKPAMSEFQNWAATTKKDAGNVTDFATKFGTEAKKTINPSLVGIRGTIKGTGAFLGKYGNDIYTNLPTNRSINIMDVVAPGFKLPGDNTVRIKDLNPQAATPWAQWSQDLQNSAQEDLKTVDEFYKANPIPSDGMAFQDKIKDPQFIARGLTMSVPSFLASLGAGVAVTFATKNPVAGFMAAFGPSFALASGDIYNDAISFGADDRTARTATLIGSVPVAMLDTIGVGKLINRLPASQEIKKGVLREFTRDVLAKGLLKTGESALTEGGTESIQQILQNATARFYDQNRDLFAGVPESAFFGALQGGGASVALAPFEGKVQTPQAQPPQVLGQQAMPAISQQFEQPQEGFLEQPQFRVTGAQNQQQMQMAPNDIITAAKAIEKVKNSTTLAEQTSDEYLKARRTVQDLAQDYLGKQFVNENRQLNFDTIVDALQERVNFDTGRDNYGLNNSVDEQGRAMLGETIMPNGVPGSTIAAAEPQFRTAPPTEGYNLTKEEASQQLEKIFDKSEIGFITGEAGSIVTPDGQLAAGKYFNSIIQAVESGGKVEDKTVYHEAFHAYVDKFADKEVYKAVLKEIREQYNSPDNQAANEQAAEMFAEWLQGRQTFSGRIQAFFADLYNQLKGLVGKKNQAQAMFSDIMAGKRGEGVSQDGAQYSQNQVSPEEAALLRSFVQSNGIDTRNLTYIAYTLQKIDGTDPETFLSLPTSEKIDIVENALTQTGNNDPDELTGLSPAQAQQVLDAIPNQNPELMAEIEEINQAAKDIVENQPELAQQILAEADKQEAPADVIDTINQVLLSGDVDGALQIHQEASQDMQLPPFEEMHDQALIQRSEEELAREEATRSGIQTLPEIAQYDDIIKKAVRTYNLHKAKGRYDIAKAVQHNQGLDAALDALSDHGIKVNTMDDLATYTKGIPKKTSKGTKVATKVPTIEESAAEPSLDYQGSIAEALKKQGITAEEQNGEKWWQKFGNRARNVIARQGEAGKELANDLVLSRDRFETLLATLANSAKPLKQISKTDFAKAVDVIEGRAVADSQVVTDAANVMRGILDTTISLAQAADNQIGKLDNYFPHIYDNNFFKKNYEKSISHLIETGQAKDRTEAAIIINGLKYRVNDRKAANLDFERQGDLPGYKKDFQALSQYLVTSARRIADLEFFGRNDAKAIEKLDRISQEGRDRETAKAAFDVAVGNTNYGRTAQKISGFLRAFQSFTNLSLAAVANVTQSTNTASVINPLRTLMAVGKLTDPQERAFVEETGVIMDEIIKNSRELQSGVRGRFGDVALPGFSYVEKTNRSIAAIGGKYYARDMAAKAAGGDAGAIRALEKLGLDAEKVVEQGGILTKDQEIEAARRIVERTQFRVDAQDLPYWADSPAGKLITQFKQFPYNQSAFMMREIFGEARKGNVAPALSFLLVGGAMGTAARAILDGLKGNEDDEESMLGTIMNSYNQVGTFGLGSDLMYLLDIDPAKYGASDKFANKLTSTVLGPTAGMVVQGAKAGVEAAGGDTRAAQYMTLGRVPGVGAILKGQLNPWESSTASSGGSVPLAVAGSSEPGSPIDFDGILNDGAISPTEVIQLKAQKKALQEQQESVMNDNAKSFLGIQYKAGKADATKNDEYNAIQEQIDSIDNIIGLSDVINAKNLDGIEKYKNDAEKIKKARDVFDNTNMSDRAKEAVYKTLGLDAQEVSYDFYANQTTEISANYLYDALVGKDESEIMKTLIAGRRESISGQLLSSDSVLKELTERGLIGYDDYKVLQDIKFNNKGENVAGKTSAPKKPKKISFPKIPTAKMPKSRLKIGSQASLKPLKAMASGSKPVSMRTLPKSTFKSNGGGFTLNTPKKVSVRMGGLGSSV